MTKNHLKLISDSHPTDSFNRVISFTSSNLLLILTQIIKGKHLLIQIIF